MRKKPKIIDYDDRDREYTGGTETEVAVDEPVEKEYGNQRQAMKAGFSQASGVRGEVMESGGHGKAPELKDKTLYPRQPRNPADKEDSGLADN